MDTSEEKKDTTNDGDLGSADNESPNADSGKDSISEPSAAGPPVPDDNTAIHAPECPPEDIGTAGSSANEEGRKFSQSDAQSLGSNDAAVSAPDKRSLCSSNGGCLGAGGEEYGDSNKRRRVEVLNDTYDFSAVKKETADGKADIETKTNNAPPAAPLLQVSEVASRPNIEIPVNVISTSEKKASEKYGSVKDEADEIEKAVNDSLPSASVGGLGIKQVPLTDDQEASADRPKELCEAKTPDSAAGASASDGSVSSSSLVEGSSQIVAPPRPFTSSHNGPRWRTHQMAEDYISLAGDLMYPSVRLGPFGYDPAHGLYPIERVAALGVLTSPLRRPSVVEKWSPYEIAVFESALSLYGKHFHQVQKVVRTKSTKEIIEFYYIWKKTSHYKVWKRQYEPDIPTDSEDD